MGFYLFRRNRPCQFMCYVFMCGDQKNVLFRETQRFTLVYWVKLLILQPWGPCWSHGETNYGQKWSFLAICDNIWQ